MGNGHSGVPNRIWGPTHPPLCLAEIDSKGGGELSRIPLIPDYDWTRMKESLVFRKVDLKGEHLRYLLQMPSGHALVIRNVSVSVGVSIESLTPETFAE